MRGGRQHAAWHRGPNAGESFPLPPQRSPTPCWASPPRRTPLVPACPGCPRGAARCPVPVRGSSPQLCQRLAGPQTRGHTSRPAPAALSAAHSRSDGREQRRQTRVPPRRQPPSPKRAALPLRRARTELAHLCPWSSGTRQAPGPSGPWPEDPRGPMPSARPRASPAARLPARLVAGLAAARPSPAWPRRGLREPESPAGRGRASAGWGGGRLLPPRRRCAVRGGQRSLAERAGMGAGAPRSPRCGAGGWRGGKRGGPVPAFPSWLWGESKAAPWIGSTSERRPHAQPRGAPQTTLWG